MKPEAVKVVGILAMVRNSVGENSYVADEIILARSGARVRVGNTDAEGRMIMADTLCYVSITSIFTISIVSEVNLYSLCFRQAKEQALKSVNPHLMTIATLTGHAYLTVGKGYSVSTYITIHALNTGVIFWQ